MGKLTIQQILGTIEAQFRHGKTYLAIAIGLSEAEPVVSSVAPTFFGIMAEGGFVMAQMCLARLYDRHRGTVTIPMMFEEANRQHRAFKKADAAAISTAVREAKAKVAKLSRVLAAITHRRNTWFAHTDPGAVNDPVTHRTKAELTIPQLRDAFDQTETIIKDFDYLLDGVIGPICFLGGDDYKNLCAVLRRDSEEEMQRFDEAFRKQFGHAPPRVSPNLARVVRFREELKENP